MKRLFVLVNMQGKKFRTERGDTAAYFESKQEAKACRDGLNEALGRTEWRVSRGPDNKKSAKPHSRSVSGLPKYQRGNRGHSSW